MKGIGKNSKEKLIKFGFLNVNSINSDERSIALNELIISEGIDVMCIAETKLPYDKSMKNSSLCPDGFRMYHKARKGSKFSGGVGMILSKTFKKVKIIDDFIAESFEYLRLIFTFEKETFDMSVVYRPPGKGSTQSRFIDEFNSYLEMITTNSHYKLILGDFNFHMDIENDPKVRSLSTSLSDNDFEYLACGPTHSGGHTLDLALVPKGQTLGAFSIHPEKTFSDHYVLLGQIPISITSAKLEKKFTSRPFKKAKIHVVNKTIDEKLTCDGNIINFRHDMNEFTDQYFPLTETTFVSKPDKPWFTKTIDTARRDRRRLERKFQKTGADEDKSLFIEKRNEVNKLISSTKYKYFTGLFKKAGRNSKEIFKVLNMLNGLDTDIIVPTLGKLDPKLCASNFSEFYEDKIEKFQSEIQIKLSQAGVSDSPSLVSDDCRNTFCTFSPIDLKQCIEIFNKCKKTYVPELDCTNFNIFCENPEVICKYLCPIINSCLQNGIYPEIENRGVICPKIKGDNLDIEILNNYRPITRSSFEAKMIDTTIYEQM